MDSDRFSDQFAYPKVLYKAHRQLQLELVSSDSDPLKVCDRFLWVPALKTG